LLQEFQKINQFANFKLECEISSSIIFLQNISNQKILKILGEEYCILQYKIQLGDSPAKFSDHLICVKQDRISSKNGEKKIDISKKTITPIFDNNIFDFYLEAEHFIGNQYTI